MKNSMPSYPLYSCTILTLSFAFGGVEVPLNPTTINEVLEVPEVPNLKYESKLKKIDLGCCGTLLWIL